MLKRPQWVKEKIEGREKNIPVQMTVKKKYSPQISYVNMPTMGMNTGNGIDGKVQPGKMVDIQVHEGEGIIPNNAMQGLTEEEFQGLVETLSSGNIDKNKFREAINMPTVSEYRTGGVVQYSGGVPQTSEIPNERPTDITTSRSRGVPSASSGATAVTQDYANKDPVSRRSFGTSGFEGNTAEATTTLAPIETPTRQTIQTPVMRVATTPPETIQTKEVKQPETIQTNTVTREQPAFEFKPPPPIPQQTIPPETAPAETPPTETTPAETVTQPVVSPAGEMVRVGLQNILKEAQGVSDVDRKIANFYLQNTDASNAANLRILESQISADPDMSDQGKRAAIAGLQREAAANRSQLTGELAIDAAKRASNASRDLVTYGGQVRTYEEITLPTSRQNLEIAKRTFDEITKPMSDLQIKQLESQLGAQNWDEIQDMINKGMDINRVNEALAEKGMRPLNIDEFVNMLNAGSLGERNWSRQLAAAQTLLATPGENNKEAASQMLSNLYGGVDFDFSQLVSQENAEIFSQGLSQMASYIAAGIDFDTALTAMKKDETFAMLGMDESQIAQLYNATKVNALDKEWEEVETSQQYQELLNSTDPAKREMAANIKQFNLMAKMGMLDYDTLHEYKITGPDGTPKGSVYAKTAEEAQKQANEYGVGYSVEDTGNINFTIKEEPTTEIQGGVSGKWEEFKKSIPKDVTIDQDLYKRWESWQENNTGNYEEFLKTETPANKLQTINVGTNEELLDTENSKIIWDAYKTNPDEFKTSDFYFQYPDKKYIRDNIKTTIKSGKTKTWMSDTLKSTFNDATGKMVELPNGTSGQVVEVNEYPHSIQLTVKQKDGTYKKYVVYERGK